MSIHKSKPLLVSDVMLPIGQFPVVNDQVIFKEALEEMGCSRLGIACVVDLDNSLLGVLTDGDIRRKLLKVQKPFSALLVDDAIDHAILSPFTITPGETLADAVSFMGVKQVWDLPVVTSDRELVGLLHLHPAIKALIGKKK